MNPSLVQELLEDQPPTLRILYGVATGANTVLVAGSTVAVVLPALSPVVSGDYVAVLATGADRLILGPVADTAWTAVTFTNSWVNLGPQPAQYRKIGDIVYVRGQISGGATSSSAFTLPAGFRPPLTLDLPLIAFSGGPVVALAGVGATGAFAVWTAATGNVSINCQFSVAP